MHRFASRVSLAGLVVLAAGCGMARKPALWEVAGNDVRNYQVQGSGDPVSGQGATVTLHAEHADLGKHGVSFTSIDAAPYRGHTLKLSADLDTRDAAMGASIWLRADGATGRVAFASSQVMAVSGTTTAHREVQMDVPDTATRLTMGTALIGDGEVVGKNLRLTQLAPRAEVAPAVVLDAAIALVRSHALRTREVDWSQVEPQLRAMAQGARHSKDAYPAIRALLAALGDHHSYFMEPWQRQQRTTQGGAVKSPSVALKDGDIGYISMPGYEGMEVKARRAFVSHMVDAIGNIAPQAQRGWIVDLRQDTGGSMLPMLAGLRPLLGEGTIGGFRDASGGSYPLTASSQLDKDLPTGPDLQHAPVAVITGPHTSSSGEIVAIAFRGRAATRSFGLPTDGRSTGNTLFPLPDGSAMVLTTAVDLDRTGRAYGDPLVPDQVVADHRDGGNDAELAAAMSWLTHRAPGP